MKTYYEVTKRHNDRGRIVASITQMISAEMRPACRLIDTENGMEQHKWFASAEEAQAEVEAVNGGRGWPCA